MLKKILLVLLATSTSVFAADNIQKMANETVQIASQNQQIYSQADLQQVVKNSYANSRRVGQTYSEEIKLIEASKNDYLKSKKFQENKRTGLEICKHRQTQVEIACSNQ